MKKIDSSLIVCSAAISQQLVALGILPVACMCYEIVAGNYEFSGEYVGQDPVLPAWTMEELNILIGGDFPQVLAINEKTKEVIVKYPKPDLWRSLDWAQAANMMKYVLHLPFRRVETLNGAEAYAALLHQLILDGKLKVEECNARMEAFISKDFFNPITEKLEKESKKNLR